MDSFTLGAGMDRHVIAANVLRLRKKRGLNQEEAAIRAGLSRPAYRAIEKGEADPRAATVDALARGFDVPLREFFVAAPVMTRVRFRSLKRMKRRDDVLHDVGVWLQEFSSLERLLEERSLDAISRLRACAMRHVNDGMPASAAAIRAELGLDLREPVHDICGLLESRGIKVRGIDVASDAFYGLSVAEDHGGPAVVVNTWHRIPVEQWIHSAAHEFAHLLFHLGAYDVEQDREDKQQERDADEFASHFLMPEAAFRREWEAAAGLPTLSRIYKVKRVFRVSWRSVAYRVAVAWTPERQRLWWKQLAIEQQRALGRPSKRLDEPQPLPPDAFRAMGTEPAALERYDFQSDRLARLVRQGVESGKISLGRSAEILAISLSDMRLLAASWVP